MEHLQLINSSPWYECHAIFARHLFLMRILFYSPALRHWGEKKKKHTASNPSSATSSEIGWTLLRRQQGLLPCMRGQTRRPEIRPGPNSLSFLFKTFPLDSSPSPCCHTDVICIDFVISLDRCLHVRFVSTAKASLWAEDEHRARPAGPKAKTK